MGMKGSSAGGGGTSGHYSEAKAKCVGGDPGFLLFTVWRGLDHILVFTGSFPFPTPHHCPMESPRPAT